MDLFTSYTTEASQRKNLLSINNDYKTPDESVIRYGMVGRAPCHLQQFLLVQQVVDTPVLKLQSCSSLDRYMDKVSVHEEYQAMEECSPDSKDNEYLGFIPFSRLPYRNITETLGISQESPARAKQSNKTAKVTWNEMRELVRDYMSGQDDRIKISKIHVANKVCITDVKMMRYTGFARCQAPTDVHGK
eukprot:334270-Hanusia_phi.AAC.2